MKIALAASFAFAALFWVDPDLQPDCRAGCEGQYEEEIAACKQQTQQPVDECLDAAQDRHQECIDRCND